jgi:hypothetical protein
MSLHVAPARYMYGPFALAISLAEWESPSSVSGLETLFLPVEHINVMRTRHGEAASTGQSGCLGSFQNRRVKWLPLLNR